MELFVVCDQLPGGPDSEARFVELEDRDGASHGEDVGVRWETVSPMSGPGHALLGPFLSAEQVGQAIGRLYGCLIDPGDLEQVPEQYREYVKRAMDEGCLGPEDFPPDVFLTTWKNCLKAVGR